MLLQLFITFLGSAPPPPPPAPASAQAYSKYIVKMYKNKISVWIIQLLKIWFLDEAPQQQAPAEQQQGIIF